MYVDLVLLWLLYRFVKPQKVLNDGTTEALFLLYANDDSKAEESLYDSYLEEHDKRQAKKLKQKHDDFLDFVIQDMLASIRTESRISLEFRRLRNALL